MDEGLPGGASGFDCDGDGYSGAAEDHVYSYLPQTDGDQKTCQEYDTNFPVQFPGRPYTPSKRWPSDLSASAGPPSSFNRINILDLTSFIAPEPRPLNTSPGDPGYSVRWDLMPGATFPFTTHINIVDLTALIAGSTGNPPMLGGARAFGGPACPWAP